MCSESYWNFPGRWFYVGNAYGSTRHCRHCTLGCIAYFRLLRRFSPLRPLSRVPGTQSRRPSSLYGPRPFRHLQLRYFTEKEIYGMWGMGGVHWTVWNGCFMSSCCSGCGLGLLSFPVSPIYTLLNLLHDVLICVWNDWFMISCCNVCGVGLHSFPISPKSALLISPMISSYSSFYEDVSYTTAVQIRAQHFSRWKRWVDLKLLRAGHRRKGSTRSERPKRKHALCWYGRDCRRGTWRGLPAALKTLEHDSGDMKALWSQSIYRYVPPGTVHCRQCRKTWYWLREGRVNY